MYLQLKGYIHLFTWIHHRYLSPKTHLGSVCGSLQHRSWEGNGCLVLVLQPSSVLADRCAGSREDLNSEEEMIKFVVMVNIVQNT